MDQLITTAWRAFWVGLGASGVLIAQALIAPPTHSASGRDGKQLAPASSELAPATSAAALAPRPSLAGKSTS